MILEHALLTVRPGEQAGFEADFARARPLIAATPGFRGLRLSRCLERDTGYLLLVEWDRLEDHIEGFRGGDAYQEWKALLHPYYDPFPVVEHFTTVLTADPVPEDTP
ncbi:antibiotic biosynthesis monooxygenase family protein [Candidatus Blastococcus massiliensis]|uniref:antibiotic biosynthesis monooxygenase family protein n=1 Tax=Candidatus Blastococcus massiliensis TaxID=1470358 RepID=UPI0004BAFC16|nr:antibiotic biosynthesis monooxygenase [Candidatus Blastococcus massiliensis]